MKFLHITDLHFCPEMDGRDSRKMREQIIDYIKDKNLKADELFVTGDYRHAGLQMGEPIEKSAGQAVQLILKIASAAGITDVEHIHLIPGNHDLDRGKAKAEKDENRKRILEIRDAYSVSAGNFKEDDLLFLKGQFQFFYKVCELLYGEKNPWKGNPLHTYRIVDNTAVVYMNTAITHQADEDRGHLIIGNDELDLLLSEIENHFPGMPVIVLAHHASEYFEKEERAAVELIFRRYPVFLYLCGDAHTTWWRKINDYLEITMGCLKSAEGTESTFLYGDSLTENYQAHFWIGKFASGKDHENGWAPYQQFNDTILKNRPKRVVTRRLVEQDKEQLENEMLLPWMRHSLSYRAVFPELFIDPVMIGRKIRIEPSIEELLERYKDKNIAFTGGAGSGKTTLMRYIYLYKNPECEFLYLKAGALRRSYNVLSAYERSVIDLLYSGKSLRKRRIILLDEMDEAFLDSQKQLGRLIDRLCGKRGKLSVWFGWRTEHLNQSMTEKLSHFLDNEIEICKWDPEKVIAYINTYEEKVKVQGLRKRFEALVDKNNEIYKFAETPFHLVLITYLLEESMGENGRELDVSDLNIYSLYRQFFFCWLEKEKGRGTSVLQRESIEIELHKAAKALYYGKSYAVRCSDTAVTDLLVFSYRDKRNGDWIASNFWHRSLCAYFYADSVFQAIKKGGISLIRAFDQPLRNDVTDIVRAAFAYVQDTEDLSALQNNMMRLYDLTIHLEEENSDPESCREIGSLSNSQILILQNELIYLITRLPNNQTGVADFIDEAYRNTDNRYLKLDLAYGAVLTGPSWVGLDYARSLVPGSESDLTNRSWTVAYFGDVQANPYSYCDTGECTWEKSRNARLKRFRSNSWKALRFRILDFPLMYCFYASRGWWDVNEEDLKTIRNASVDDEIYTEGEKNFLRETKNRLTEEFGRQLCRKGREHESGSDV